jgi:malate dehydrogenase (oxaloacetate-decarboxylating)(NADP+)
VGIANLLASAIAAESGCSEEVARAKIWLVDSKGLVTAARQREAALAHHKIAYAHEAPASDDAGNDGGKTLLGAVKLLKPTALIGVSAQAGIFNEAICRELVAAHPPNATPGSPNILIFALSNPTSKAECTAAQAYEWTNGRAVFASGSPFDPVTLPDGTTRVPGQGNNAYIFPAIGLAAASVKALRITDDDMLVAARTLAAQVKPERLAVGCLYPPLDDIRQVSANIAAAVAANIYSRGDANLSPRPDDLLKHCQSMMWNPKDNQSASKL